MLTLPDGDGALDLLDEALTRGEGLGTVGGGDGGDERQVTHDEGTDPVGGGHPQAGLRGDGAAAVLQEPLGVGVRPVVERIHRLTVVVVADDATERHQRTVRRGGDEVLDRVRVER